MKRKTLLIVILLYLLTPWAARAQLVLFSEDFNSPVAGSQFLPTGWYNEGGGNSWQATSKATLTPQQWRTIFDEAADLGINFALLAGGEPLTRRDHLEQIAQVNDMIFPIFTNGTMIGPTYLDFFKTHLNMIPVISLEGDAAATDSRRGQGVYQRALQAMQGLKEAHLFYGVSITVTTENYEHVTTSQYLNQLHDMGCQLVFYVEYVPMDERTAHLAFRDEHVAHMEQLLSDRRATVARDMILLSFPGDEKALGGCLAAGRGFFHIGPDGAAEPCPFSPYSDSNVLQTGLRGALQSPLFRRIRDARALGWEHTGGCTLKLQREGVESLYKIMPTLSCDPTTYDITKAYLLDEEEDLYWDEEQLDMIEKIGIQNWLMRQM